MRIIKYFLEDAIKKKIRVNQLYFIVAFSQAKCNNRVFVKLNSRYEDYFTKYPNYFWRSLKLLKSMYGMTNSGNLFADELIEWLNNEEGFTQLKCQMFEYYMHALNGTHIVVLYYAEDCVYCYTYGYLWK